MVGLTKAEMTNKSKGGESCLWEGMYGRVTQVHKAFCYSVVFSKLRDNILKLSEANRESSVVLNGEGRVGDRSGWGVLGWRSKHNHLR